MPPSTALLETTSALEFPDEGPALHAVIEISLLETG
jgi:hypothetical protein